MKCDNCEKEEEMMYVHCKHCLEKDKPSALHEVSFDDTYVYVKCANCGRLVYQFVKMIK